MKAKIISLFLILMLGTAISGCSSLSKKPLSKEEQVDIALDYLLSNIRSNLMASNDFLGRNTASFQQVPWNKKESFNVFKKMAMDGLGGENVYRELKNFYLKEIGPDRILEAYYVFQNPEVAALINKERADLGPENFQRFEEKWRKSEKTDHDKRMKIFESFDRMAKISDGNILIAKLIGEGLIDLIQHLGVASIHVKRWRQNATESITFFDMQTRYFTSEVMRYSYQDFSLDELMRLEDVLGRPEVEAFYGVTAQALDYAYRQSIQRVISLKTNPHSTQMAWPK